MNRNIYLNFFIDNNYKKNYSIKLFYKILIEKGNLFDLYFTEL